MLIPAIPRKIAIHLLIVSACRSFYPENPNL